MNPAAPSELLALLLPRAVLWAEREAERIEREGVPLSPEEIALARQCGVAQPERVRLLSVAAIPGPDDPLLQETARSTGFVLGDAAGLTLGYGIFIQQAEWRARALIAHELVHVGQYERLGGVEGFLRRYLSDFLVFGYSDSPLEREAVEVSRAALTQAASQ